MRVNRERISESLGNLRHLDQMCGRHSPVTDPPLMPEDILTRCSMLPIGHIASVLSRGLSEYKSPETSENEDTETATTPNQNQFGIGARNATTIENDFP